MLTTTLTTGAITLAPLLLALCPPFPEGTSQVGDITYGDPTLDAYAERWRQQDLPLVRITRHMLGLFARQPGTRARCRIRSASSPRLSVVIRFPQSAASDHNRRPTPRPPVPQCSLGFVYRLEPTTMKSPDPSTTTDRGMNTIWTYRCQ